LAVLSRFLPSFPLSAYIEAFCLYEGDASLCTKERCLPTGSMAVMINLGHDTFRVAGPEHADQFQSFHGGVLNGAFSQYSAIDPTTLVTTMSICFKPDGARLFLPMPASEVTNQVIDLFTLWGTAAGTLREQLQAAYTRAEMVCILERFLLAHLAWEQTLHPAAYLVSGRERAVFYLGSDGATWCES
jgi:hypothetical protein